MYITKQVMLSYISTEKSVVFMVKKNIYKYEFIYNHIYEFMLFMKYDFIYLQKSITNRTKTLLF